MSAHPRSHSILTTAAWRKLPKGPPPGGRTSHSAHHATEHHSALKRKHSWHTPPHGWTWGHRAEANQPQKDKYYDSTSMRSPESPHSQTEMGGGRSKQRGVFRGSRASVWEYGKFWR